jgi:nanoRNase/pAp phosphatase (c-di-AMP/oligoRNAs hydrolase)
MYYYLKAAGLDLPTRLATALLMGIKSDTRDLEREASEADLHAYLEIFPNADLTLLTRIENPLIPRSHFEVFHKALEESEILGDAVVTDIGQVDNADVVAELADFLIPLEHVDYALVMGRHRDRFYLSLRTRDEGHDAGRLISTIVGDLGTAGGHGKMAGGQIELGGDGADPADEIRSRLKRALGLDPETAGKPLIRDGKG